MTTRRIMGCPPVKTIVVTNAPYSSRHAASPGRENRAPGGAACRAPGPPPIGLCGDRQARLLPRRRLAPRGQAIEGFEALSLRRGEPVQQALGGLGLRGGVERRVRCDPSELPA